MKRQFSAAEGSIVNPQDLENRTNPRQEAHAPLQTYEITNLVPGRSPESAGQSPQVLAVRNLSVGAMSWATDDSLKNIDPQLWDPQLLEGGHTEELPESLPATGDSIGRSHRRKRKRQELRVQWADDSEGGKLTTFQTAPDSNSPSEMHDSTGLMSEFASLGVAPENTSRYEMTTSPASVTICVIDDMRMDLGNLNRVIGRAAGNYRNKENAQQATKYIEDLQKTLVDLQKQIKDQKRDRVKALLYKLREINRARQYPDESTSNLLNKTDKRGKTLETHMDGWFTQLGKILQDTEGNSVLSWGNVK